MDIDGVWITRAHLPALLQLCGVHRTTATRWLDRKTLPPAIHKLLLIAWEGHLGEIHAAWAGFKIHPKTGGLVDPLGYETSPGDLMAARLRRQYKAALEKENKELRAQVLLAADRAASESTWLEYCRCAHGHDSRRIHTGRALRPGLLASHHAGQARY